MELEQEIRLLRQMLDQAKACLPELKAALAGMFAPKETPRPEILGALKMVASVAGLEAKCSNAACRRAGMCQAEDVGQPACADLWTDELSNCFDNMVTGIALSALYAERRDAVIHERITQLFETPEAAPARRRKRGG